MRLSLKIIIFCIINIPNIACIKITDTKNICSYIIVIIVYGTELNIRTVNFAVKILDLKKYIYFWKPHLHSSQSDYIFRIRIDGSQLLFPK